MDPLLEKWLANALAKPGRQVAEPFRVVGVRDQHLGPTWQKAEIEVHVAPSAAFAAEIADAKLLSMEAQRYLEWALFGLLDVLLPSDLVELDSARFCVRMLSFYEIESSAMAFRWAGRDAGQRILAAFRDT